jgi:threonine dehydrogenase-like Zn-dependent dehydrogenase
MNLRQVIFPAHGVAELALLPLDETPPAKGEIRGETLASVISPGTELGSQYFAEAGFPHRPGYGAVFRVQAAGAGVRTFAPGDLAFCIGKHVSQQRCPADQAVPVPAGLDPVIATCCRLMAIGQANLVLTAVKAPARVLVTGLGPIGHLTARIFALAGFTVTAVDPDPHRRAQLAAVLTGQEILAAWPIPDPGRPGPFALALECTGREAVIHQAGLALQKHGELRLIGVPWSFDPQVLAGPLLQKVFWRHLRLVSGYEWELPWRGAPGYADLISAGLAMLADGRLRLDGLLAAVAPAECARIYQDLANRRAQALLSVFDWRR